MQSPNTRILFLTTGRHRDMALYLKLSNSNAFGGLNGTQMIIASTETCSLLVDQVIETSLYRIVVLPRGHLTEGTFALLYRVTERNSIEWTFNENVIVSNGCSAERSFYRGVTKKWQKRHSAVVSNSQEIQRSLMVA